MTRLYMGFSEDIRRCFKMRNVENFLLEGLGVFDLALLAIGVVGLFEIVFVSMFNSTFYIDK